MAQLAQMTLQFIESLLNDNPTTQIFTSYFFSDINNPSAVSPAVPSNPTRTQVLAAYQSQVDQSKYGPGGIVNGAVIPLPFPDPSTQSLSGSIANVPNPSNGASSAQNGQAGQTPINAVTVTQASIAPVPAIVNQSDDNVGAGVFPIPPVGNNYVQRIYTNGQVK